MKDDDVVGSTDFTTGPSPGRAVLIKVKDVPALVKAKGGGMGALAVTLAPESVGARVYSEMATKMADGLKAEGVDADVTVVVPAGFSPAGSNPIWKPLAIGFGAAGFSYLGYRVVSHFLKKKGAK